MFVAICDDEDDQLNSLEKLMQGYVAPHSLQISRFNSGEALLEEYESGARYDILFLDVKMGGLSGIETARRLRQNGSKVLIIFLTNVMDFALEGYEVNAFRYLTKPLTEEKFRGTFEKALREASILSEKYYIINSVENEIFRLDMDDIFYFESFRRRVIVHLKGKSIEYIANISSVEGKLAPFGFFRIHKSYLVSQKHIEHISRSAVTLSDGTELPLSRQRYKTVFNTFTQYLAGSFK